MSKSKGNFITLIQAIEEYGADAARMACATAGDSINDANFTK
jgi:leucyl-tRNA synthetase